MNPLPIPGCRHDILGHHLKAIGLLRMLATCAEPVHRDADAEGWWDLDSACFKLRSQKYPTEEKLVEFFAEHYRPTPIFSPWNTGGGLDEKRELVVTFSKIKVDRKGNQKPGKPTQEETNRLIRFIFRNRHAFRSVGLDVLKKIRYLRKSPPAKGEFSFVVESDTEPIFTRAEEGVATSTRVKTSAKKDVIAILERDYAGFAEIADAIKVNRAFREEFRIAERSHVLRVLESLRDRVSHESSMALDAILTTRVRQGDNPVFLNRGKGEGGNDELFRVFWNFFHVYRKYPEEFVNHSLFGRSQFDRLPRKDTEGKGTPFFPDAIKTYNNGLGWIVETFPFNALDYLLAVEGALALRGAVSRTLAANSRRFAAFPFIFDSGEDFIDEKGEVTDIASSIWLPLWDRPVTFAELESFICDAQARLPGKEARFSAEFARALRAQGVDAGFAGWQEFRFKMKASRVPWVCTGRYLDATANRQALQLNDALAPLDESGFLDQFELRYKGNKIDSRSPHPVRASLNAVIEEVIASPTPEGALEILVRLYAACRPMTLSESFRETLRGGRAVYFDALPQKPWENLLQGMEQVPEFRIARALASITGLERQRRQANGKPVSSEAQPFLGSLLPLKRGSTGWYLPTDSKDSSKQAVWSGIDLCSDLANVLARRYLDSLDDDLPALRSPRPAPLADILAFLNGDLDDHRIARWTEALSLIGWHWRDTGHEDRVTESEEPQSEEQQPEGWPAIPPAFAALRALLEVECEWQGDDASRWQKRRSQRPIALLCERSPSSLALAVEEALRWLSIWGVPNCWGEESRSEKSRLRGRDVILADHRTWRFDHDPKFVRRLAAAVAIPLDWRDRWQIYRAVTLPQSK